MSRVFEWVDPSRCFEQELVVVVFLQILKKVIESDVVSRYFTQRLLDSVKVTSSNCHLHHWALGGWYQTILVTYKSIREDKGLRTLTLTSIVMIMNETYLEWICIYRVQRIHQQRGRIIIIAWLRYYAVIADKYLLVDESNCFLQDEMKNRKCFHIVS